MPLAVGFRLSNAQQAEEISEEPNRAIVAARNAEIRCEWVTWRLGRGCAAKVAVTQLGAQDDMQRQLNQQQCHKRLVANRAPALAPAQQVQADAADGRH
jgi:hypothetical protein